MVGEPYPRPPVVEVALPERATLHAASGRHECAESGIIRIDDEVVRAVVLLDVRRLVLVAEAQIERQLGRDLPVVLQVGFVSVAMATDVQRRAEAHRAGQAEQAVGNFVARSADAGNRPSELPVEIEPTPSEVGDARPAHEVADVGAHLQRVIADRHREALHDLAHVLLARVRGEVAVSDGSVPRGPEHGQPVDVLAVE